MRTNKHPKKLCFVTGTRADYGLLYWLLKEVQSDPKFEMSLIVTGMHLSPAFGLTYKVIEADGFKIDAKIESLLASDTAVGIAKSIGLGVAGFAEAFDRLKPDLVVVLGDRFETFAATQAAMTACLPIAHIHGGEVTQGVIDEPIRHAITKMAHLHFTTTEAYRQRVIQLGEDPNRVFTVGAPGLEHFRRSKLLDRDALEKRIDFKLGKKNLLVTYHPTSLDGVDSQKAIAELLAALDEFPEAKIIFTGQNADLGGATIGRLLAEYVNRNAGRAAMYTSLGQAGYLSLMSLADAVIGNSSSGIIEAPTAKVPTVNIGNRQAGRIAAESVIHTDGDRNAITAAIRKALSPEFKRFVQGVVNPYGTGEASLKIKQQLESADLHGIVFKKFYDVEFTT